ncbi:MAG: NADH-quinone oxidoreductase subunit NuoF [Bacillota bacterium]|nr:NADH-quinone oxidoreductase subunit NuoF [Bacillota bacterium]
MKSLEELKVIREQMHKQNNLIDSNKIRILVGMATCGIAAGATPVMQKFLDETKARGLKDVEVIQTGCSGVCRLEPIAEVYIPGKEKVTYVKLNADMVSKIIDEHIVNNNIVKEYTIGATDNSNVTSLNDTEFYKHQERLVLRNCGIINPESIDEYIGVGGAAAPATVLTTMSPEDVIKTILDAGLRGRGGAGFPTGKKWQFAHDAVSPDGVKYICCNADEGDPGAFMDRSVLEGDPHSVIEAMAIGGYAIGAHQGYIYVRAEYPTAVKRLNIAIKQAKEYGLLGKDIYGTGFDFDLELRLGAGAFVCGEETALMHSIEGYRGEPKNRPPFPANKGLFDRPTVLNNVETYANITWIINNGVKAYKKIGTKKSPGTKVFALGGKINNTGLVEVPMGTPLRTVIEDIGGFVPNGKKFKAAQTGGPSGGCIPYDLIDTPLDFDSVGKVGSMIGSGGLIVMDEDNCMVDIAKFFLDFIIDESCGKCTPCRIGTMRMYELLDKITKGKGTLEDIDKLEELCKHIQSNALCGLGQSAPNPVLSTLMHFRSEYISHVVDRKCPAGVCKDLIQYVIDPAKCKGCTLCAKNCPANAITGELKNPHVIDQTKCIKCGTCMNYCKFNAIDKR